MAGSNPRAAPMHPRPELRGEFRSATGLATEVGKVMRSRERNTLWLAAATVVTGAFAWSVTDSFLALLLPALLAPVIVFWLPTALIRPPDQAVVVAFLPNAVQQIRDWRRYSGGVPFPIASANRRQWLASHPADGTDPILAGFHGMFLVQDGEYQAAADLAERLTVATPSGRFEQTLALAQLEYERNGTGDTGDARVLLAEITDHDDRSRAEFALAFDDARRALIAGGDWRYPFASPAFRRGVLGQMRATLDLVMLRPWSLLPIAIVWISLVLIPFVTATLG